MSDKLDLKALTALVIGSMIGAGVFSLPQNMAAVASPAAVMIGWGITGLGMICLAFTFQSLIRLRPHIHGGVFGYAQAGFGDFIGFFSAWGYWLSASVANVSFLVIVCSTLGLFFDTDDQVWFGQGNTLLSLALSSALIWLVHILVLRGVRTAAVVNFITIIAKLIPIVVFIIAATVAFRWDTFSVDFTQAGAMADGNLFEQVRQTMIITVWVFIGVEGAVVVSSRAKEPKDVGRATILGLLICLFLYVSVTLLSMGIISTPELAALPNPSTAKILAALIGETGTLIVGIGLIISVAGAYLSWTLLATETPYAAAEQGMFPRIFSKVNDNFTPTHSLLATSVLVQLCLLLTFWFRGGYDNLLVISSEMILVPYLLVALFLLKIAYQEAQPLPIRVLAWLATLYGMWLLFASGLHHLLLSALLYLPGLVFFWYAKRASGASIFSGRNLWLSILLVVAASCAIVLLIFGVEL
ncbi:amino acid permease [Vibrio sp. SM6]|uniref:Amino acid permease n=1 Tax=Vibrio agarilyticus TaxID=2726741 RepID=A0A7X8TTK0_9VIBR|nr:basic amino acid/polyamine antiporter [Vibrio agarilyticus]NLS14297.1 amino acid permease [Vibrio agarilyticus]